MQSKTFVSGLMALGLAAAQASAPFPSVNGTTTASSTSSVVAVDPTQQTLTTTTLSGTAGSGTTVTGAPTTTTEANGAVVVVETVTALTTVCPAATTFVAGQNSQTFTATAGQTITVVDCPCKATKTIVPAQQTPAVIKPNGTVFWTTEVVQSFTTVCPTAGQLTTNGATLTYTASQTLVVDQCPCTISKPVTLAPPASQNATQFTTAVVSTLTIPCPSATTIITNGVTIPVPTGGTTVTLGPNVCPCTVVQPVPSNGAGSPPGSHPPGSNPPAGNPPVNAPASPTPTVSIVTGPKPSTSAPFIATGAAAQIGSSLMAVVAGLFAFAA